MTNSALPTRLASPTPPSHRSGHTKGVAAIRFIPNSAHLLLSAGMDSKIKLWEVYGERRVVRTYLGSQQAVRDVCFNNDGTRFVSCGYDKFCRVWDTETGKCIAHFTNKKVPYCVKFHPSEDKQNLFVAGTQDKKILCYDINSGATVQEYDRCVVKGSGRVLEMRAVRERKAMRVKNRNQRAMFVPRCVSFSFSLFFSSLPFFFFFFLGLPFFPSSPSPFSFFPFLLLYPLSSPFPPFSLSSFFLFPFFPFFFCCCTQPLGPRQHHYVCGGRPADGDNV